MRAKKMRKDEKNRNVHITLNHHLRQFVVHWSLFIFLHLNQIVLTIIK